MYSLGVLNDEVKDHVMCGLLLCLRQLIPLVTMETDDILLLPKLYCLLLRCCLHSNHNVVTSALEALSVLLWKPATTVIMWLTTELDHMIPLCPMKSDDITNEHVVSIPFNANVSSENVSNVEVSNDNVSNDNISIDDLSNDVCHFTSSGVLVTSFPRDSNVDTPSPSSSDIPLEASPSSSDIDALPSPSDSDKPGSPGQLSDDSVITPENDNDSLLMPCDDDHFVVSLSTNDASVSVSLASAHPTSATPLLSCDLPDVDVNAFQLPGTTTCRTPIQALLQLVGTRLLTDNVRVSVKAVAMQCIVAITMWSPQQLLVTMETQNTPKLIDLLLPYIEFDDPKLCGNCCQVLSYYIKGLLIWDTSDHTMSVSLAIDKIVKVFSDSSATVLHAAIPSLQVSLSSCDLCCDHVICY